MGTGGDTRGDWGGRCGVRQRWLHVVPGGANCSGEERGAAGAPPSPGLPRGAEPPTPVCVLAEKEEIDHPNNSFNPCSIHDRKCLQKQQAKRVNNGNKMRNSGSPYHREETRPIVSTAWHRGGRAAPGWRWAGEGRMGAGCSRVGVRGCWVGVLPAQPPSSRRRRARARASCTGRWRGWRPRRPARTRTCTSSPSPTATATATSTPSR